MAIDLRDTLDRLKSKTTFLIEKYNATKAEKERVENLNANLQEEIEQLKKELEKAQLEKEYLQLARNISISSKDLADSKAILTQLVRDVNKCIAQLTE